MCFIKLKWKGDCWGRVCSLRRTIGRWLTPVSSRPFPQDTKSMSSRWPPRMSSFLWESGWCSAARPRPSWTWASNSTGRTLVRRWSVPHALPLSFSVMFNERLHFKLASISLVHTQTDISEVECLASCCPRTSSWFPAFRNPSVYLHSRSKCKGDQMCLWCSVFSVDRADNF